MSFVYAHLLLVFKLPIKFDLIPSSGSREISRTRTLVYKTIINKERGHNSVKYHLNGMSFGYAHFRLVYKLPIKIQSIPLSGSREIDRTKNGFGPTDGHCGPYIPLKKLCYF